MISNEYEYLILELCETWQSPAKIQNYVPNGDLVMIYHSSTDNTDKTNHLLNTSKHTWSHKNPFWKCSKKQLIVYHLLPFTCVLSTTTYANSQQAKHTSFPHNFFPLIYPRKYLQVVVQTQVFFHGARCRVVTILRKFREILLRGPNVKEKPKPFVFCLSASFLGSVSANKRFVSRFQLSFFGCLSAVWTMQRKLLDPWVVLDVRKGLIFWSKFWDQCCLNLGGVSREMKHEDWPWKWQSVASK